ncbi:MAG: hypothetical protein L0H93_14495, partial [Nocardioides sp.]|nr:hypothetical protein [Nocardioides sp.]
MLSLQKIVQDARSDGWVCVNGQIDSAVYQASILGWEIVPSRNGQLGVETLTPVEAAAAPAQSLSAMTGLDTQPLHTDGAHYQAPPDILLLSVTAPSTVPTLLVRLSKVNLSTADRAAAEHGIF